jgi:hypothetical protein
MANDFLNHLPTRDDGQAPIERFAGVKARVCMRQWHTFGCPAYVVHDALQSGRKISKWESRSRIGIYLGNSPVHASSVYLILNPATGLVSPQFHVRMDNEFHTVEEIKTFPDFHCLWQQKCHFTPTKESPIEFTPFPTGTAAFPFDIQADETTPKASNKRTATAPLSEGDSPAKRQRESHTPVQALPDTSHPTDGNNGLSIIHPSVSDGPPTEQRELLPPTAAATPCAPVPTQSFPPTTAVSNAQPTRRSTRISKPPQRLIETMQSLLHNDEVMIFHIGIQTDEPQK